MGGLFLKDFLSKRSLLIFLGMLKLFLGINQPVYLVHERTVHQLDNFYSFLGLLPIFLNLGLIFLNQTWLCIGCHVPRIGSDFYGIAARGCLLPHSAWLFPWAYLLTTFLGPSMDTHVWLWAPWVSWLCFINPLIQNVWYISGHNIDTIWSYHWVNQAYIFLYFKIFFIILIVWFNRFALTYLAQLTEFSSFFFWKYNSLMSIYVCVYLCICAYECGLCLHIQGFPKSVYTL